MSHLLSLPNELLLIVGVFLLQYPSCLCHHLSRHLSAFSRSNRLLHAVLTPYLLSSAPAMPILIWAIHHSRPDTTAFALQRGANPNARVYTNRRFVPHLYLGTPVDLASRMLATSPNATVHTVKLRIVGLLIAAGGKPTVASTTIAARRGDLDLLELCLLPFTEHHGPPCRTILFEAGMRGHVQVITMLIASGAKVNTASGVNYYPPLWRMCRAPLAVLQKLLDAGADARWEHNGVSIAEYLRSHTPESDVTLDLLSRYGARMPKGEEGIMLWQAPVWESWTAQGEGEPVEMFVEPVGGRAEYRGWVTSIYGNERGWMRKSVCQQDNGSCGCPECPGWKPFTYRMVEFTVE